VTNAFVNEARISFQCNLAILQDQLPPGDTPQNLGITPINPSQTQAPPITFLVNGFTANGLLDPNSAPNTQIQHSDQISWTRGRHTIRAGFEFEKTQYNLVNNGLPRGWMFMGSFADMLVGGGPGSILQTLFNVRSGPDGIIHAMLSLNGATWMAIILARCSRGSRYCGFFSTM
jgi:hypothetical protein